MATDGGGVSTTNHSAFPQVRAGSVGRRACAPTVQPQKCPASAGFEPAHSAPETMCWVTGQLI